MSLNSRQVRTQSIEIDEKNNFEIERKMSGESDPVISLYCTATSSQKIPVSTFQLVDLYNENTKYSVFAVGAFLSTNPGWGMCIEKICFLWH